MSNSDARRVVITGVGAVSPIGNSLEAIWESLVNGRSGVSPLTAIPSMHLPTDAGGEARDFRGVIGDYGPLKPEQKRAIRKGLKVMCREIQMGVAAAQFALASAKLEQADPERTGVILGTDHITTMPDEFVDGVRTCVAVPGEFRDEMWPEIGMPKLTPLWMLKYLPNMPASHVAIFNDFRGPNNSLIYREASSNLAIAEGFCTIARGMADCILTGATGSCIHPLKTLHIAMQMELADNDADPARRSRPFDNGRTGMVLGEGAGAVVLEELEHAKNRGAEILAEVVGYGSSIAVRKNSVADIETAVSNSIAMALRNSNLRMDDIGHIHAHGLSTLHGDQQEAAAIARHVAGNSNSARVAAAKSYFGNLGAGGGAVELICSLLAIRNGRLFPVLNCEDRDPKCPIRIADEDSDPGQSVLNINYTPQGQASCVIVRARLD